MSEVRLSLGLDDFISPSAACVKPVKLQKKPVTGRSRAVLQLEGVAGRPEAEGGGVAKITLNDCLACSGCITSAESVLVAQHNSDELIRRLRGAGSGAAGAPRLAVVVISAAARAAVAAHTGVTIREAHRRLDGFVRSLGAAALVDLSLASDLYLLQTAAEFAARYRAAHPHLQQQQQQQQQPAGDEGGGGGGGGGGCTGEGGGAASTAVAGGGGPLPLVSSSCPGWVCYAEKTQGAAVLPHLSRVKSPQQIGGTLLKRACAPAASVSASEALVVSVMPCFDKKLEASRGEFADADGTRDVDLVVSTAELLSLVDEAATAKANPKAAHEPARAAPPPPPPPPPPASAAAAAAEPSSRAAGLLAVPPCDAPLPAPLAAFAAAGGDAGGASGFTYAAAGASGGVAEFVFRSAAAELFGVRLPADEPLAWVSGRNADVAELTLTVEGRPALRFVRAYGFRNIQNVVRRVKTGRCAYHFVELMACPAGCANGGGQPRPPPLEASGRAAAVEAALVAPGEAARRHPCDNPAVASLFREGAFLEGGPLGAAVASQLTTEFNALADEPPTEQSALGIQW